MISQRVPSAPPGLAHRDVHVGAQVALLHVAVAGAEVAQDGAQLLHVGRRLVRRAHVGEGDDLHQRRAGAVEVDVGGVRVEVVDRLAGVLLQVQPLDPHREAGAVVALHLDLALADDRVLVLADLIALRQVRIEVVLPVEAGPGVDLRLQAEAGAHRLLDADAVDHRQHARHGGVDQADLLVRPRAEAHRRAGEQLRLRGDLGVHLQPDDDLPGAGAPFDQFGICRGHGGDVVDPSGARICQLAVKAALTRRR